MKNSDGNTVNPSVRLKALNGYETSFEIGTETCEICEKEIRSLVVHFASEVDGDDCTTGICLPCIILAFAEDPA